MKKADETRITVRFPAELIEELKALHVEYGLSLNSEIVQAVRDYVTLKKRERGKREKSI